MAKNILFIGGSLNQTKIMHQIASHMTDFECYFTPFYADGLTGFLSRIGFLDFSILGGKHRQATMEYLASHNLRVDFGGRARKYHAVFTCTDLMIQDNIRRSRIFLVQEGLMDPEGIVFRLVKRFQLPRWLANTAATGLSNNFEKFFVASPGYRDWFIRKGVKPEKIIVTGIPNFDNARAYKNNDFAITDYVLATTSSNRETFKFDDRISFIKKASRVAAGRKLVFKLHPNENFQRSIQEIRSVAPEAEIFTEGNVHHMIANCSLMVTQYSSVVFTGIALGKEIVADFDLSHLRKLAPVQNNGSSAHQIAEITRKRLNALQGTRRKPVTQTRTRPTTDIA